MTQREPNPFNVISEVERQHAALAADFLATHSPASDDISFEQYQVDRINEMLANERTWVVRSTETEDRTYDLHLGPKAPVAMLYFAPCGSTPAYYTVGVASQAESEAINGTLATIRSDFQKRGFSRQEAEEQVLANALLMISEYADKLVN